MARVVTFNGAGSVGKSTIAEALQAITESPFLRVAMDSFLDMLPASSFDTPDGLTFQTIEEDGHPSVVIRSGPLADRTFRGMRHAIGALAGQGNDLIVDDVAMADDIAEYREILASHRLWVVGVVAPLSVLESRERQRGDRMVGLARWQHERIHLGVDYDLVIDATASTPDASAEAVRAAFDL